MYILKDSQSFQHVAVSNWRILRVIEAIYLIGRRQSYDEVTGRVGAARSNIAYANTAVIL